MISIPVYDTINGVTVFRDDEDDAHFYYLPRQLRIARSENGDPQFTFLNYQFPLDRPAGSEPAGGYLTFTTVLEEDPDTLEEIRNQLQTRYQSEHPIEAVPRTVELASVDFTAGEVRLLTFQDEKFVRAIEAGRPSLFAQNTASVAVELPSNGATLFNQALKQGGSVGAIEYDLTFPVRLPSITIIGHVDSKEVKEAVMGYTSETVSSGNVWGGETHEESHRTSISEIMDSQGLIHLEILKGSVTLSQEDEDALRAFAFRMMDEFIKEHFLKGGTIETAEDRTSQWMSYLGQDINARFDLNVSYRDVINRTYSPSVQVNPSFLGVPLDRVVLDIDLQNAPWYYNTLEVQVLTNLDFDKFDDLVHSVVGHLSYDQPRPDGTRLVTRESVFFSKTDNKPKTFKTRLADVGKDSYHVDVEVNYKSGPVLQTTLNSFDTTTRNLTLAVPNPGVMAIDFMAEPSAFDTKLQSIEVDVKYGDPKNGVPTVTDTIILNKAHPTVSYTRKIFAPWDKDYSYTPTYVFEDEDGAVHRSTAGEIIASPVGGQKKYHTIRSPFDEIFSLTIIPSVDWKDVAQLIVDFEYWDRDSDYRMLTTKSFSAQQPAASVMWQFPLRDPDKRNFRFSQKYLMENNAFIEEPWKEVETDAQTLLVGNAPGGVVKLTVDPTDIDLGDTVKRAIVRLRYHDEANQVLDTETLVFKENTAQEWTVARKDAGFNTYSYDVEYFIGNTRSSITGQTGEFSGINDYLFVPAPVPV